MSVIRILYLWLNLFKVLAMNSLANFGPTCTVCQTPPVCDSAARTDGTTYMYVNKLIPRKVW